LLRSPDTGLVRRLLTAGPVTQVTLAPELPGALRVIADCAGAGVLVSCGHSDATAAEAHAAFDHGAGWRRTCSTPCGRSPTGIPASSGPR
jgi:N-acetylglucosamine-6-phosphate deacetylase